MLAAATSSTDSRPEGVLLLGVGCTIVSKLARKRLKPPKGKEVDHKDGNPLNNKRSNLQVISRHANRFKDYFRRFVKEYKECLITGK